MILNFKILDSVVVNAPRSFISKISGFGIRKNVISLIENLRDSSKFIVQFKNQEELNNFKIENIENYKNFKIPSSINAQTSGIDVLENNGAYTINLKGATISFGTSTSSSSKRFLPLNKHKNQLLAINFNGKEFSKITLKDLYGENFVNSTKIKNIENYSESKQFQIQPFFHNNNLHYSISFGFESEVISFICSNNQDGSLKIIPPSSPNPKFAGGFSLDGALNSVTPVMNSESKRPYEMMRFGLNLANFRSSDQDINMAFFFQNGDSSIEFCRGKISINSNGLVYITNQFKSKEIKFNNSVSDMKLAFDQNFPNFINLVHIEPDVKKIIYSRYNLKDKNNINDNIIFNMLLQGDTASEKEFVTGANAGTFCNSNSCLEFKHYNNGTFNSIGFPNEQWNELTTMNLETESASSQRTSASEIETSSIINFFKSTETTFKPEITDFTNFQSSETSENNNQNTISNANTSTSKLTNTFSSTTTETKTTEDMSTINQNNQTTIEFNFNQTNILLDSTKFSSSSNNLTTINPSLNLKQNNNQLIIGISIGLFGLFSIFLASCCVKKIRSQRKFKKYENKDIDIELNNIENSEDNEIIDELSEFKKPQTIIGKIKNTLGLNKKEIKDKQSDTDSNHSEGSEIDIYHQKNNPLYISKKNEKNLIEAFFLNGRIIYSTILENILINGENYINGSLVHCFQKSYNLLHADKYTINFLSKDKKTKQETLDFCFSSINTKNENDSFLRYGQILFKHSTIPLLKENEKVIESFFESCDKIYEKIKTYYTDKRHVEEILRKYFKFGLYEEDGYDKKDNLCFIKNKIDKLKKFYKNNKNKNIDSTEEKKHFYNEMIAVRKMIFTYLFLIKNFDNLKRFYGAENVSPEILEILLTQTYRREAAFSNHENRERKINGEESSMELKVLEDRHEKSRAALIRMCAGLRFQNYPEIFIFTDHECKYFNLHSKNYKIDNQKTFDFDSIFLELVDIGVPINHLYILVDFKEIDSYLFNPKISKEKKEKLYSWGKKNLPRYRDHQTFVKNNFNARTKEGELFGLSISEFLDSIFFDKIFENIISTSENFEKNLTKDNPDYNNLKKEFASKCANFSFGKKINFFDHDFLTKVLGYVYEYNDSKKDINKEDGIKEYFDKELNKNNTDEFLPLICINLFILYKYIYLQASANHNQIYLDHAKEQLKSQGKIYEDENKLEPEEMDEKLASKEYKNAIYHGLCYKELKAMRQNGKLPDKNINELVLNENFEFTPNEINILKRAFVIHDNPNSFLLNQNPIIIDSNETKL